VLPSVTYLVLSAIATLFAAASLEARRGSLQPALTQREEGLEPTALSAGQTGSGASVLVETGET
jgi:hypothetical protein